MKDRNNKFIYRKSQQSGSRVDEYYSYDGNSETLYPTKKKKHQAIIFLALTLY